MNIVYLTQATNIASLFLPIAYAFAEDDSSHNQTLISPASLSPKNNFTSGAIEVFQEAGFNATLFPVQEHYNQAEEKKMFAFFMAFKSFFKANKVDVVFVGYEIGPEAAAVKAAKELNILSVHIQHGLWGSNKLNSGYLDNKPSATETTSAKGSNNLNLFSTIRGIKAELSKSIRNLYATKKSNDLPLREQNLVDKLTSSQHYRLTSDLFIVPSGYYKKQVEEERQDFPLERVVEVGYLKYDTVFRKSIDRAQIASRYDLNVGSRWVIYLYSPFHLLRPGAYDICYPPDEAVYDAFLESAQYLENTQFLILSHPNWTHHDNKLMNFLSEKAEQFDVRCAVAADDHFFIYKEAALIWGVKSATMTEAAMATTPVIRQNYVLKSVYDPVQIDFGGVISVFDRNHLSLIIKELFSESDQSLMLKGKERLARLVLGKTDGKAGFRVVQTVKTMVH